MPVPQGAGAQFEEKHARAPHEAVADDTSCGEQVVAGGRRVGALHIVARVPVRPRVGEIEGREPSPADLAVPASAEAHAAASGRAVRAFRREEAGADEQSEVIGPELAPYADGIIGAADAHGDARMQSLPWFLGSAGGRETEEEERHHLLPTTERPTPATAVRIGCEICGHHRSLPYGVPNARLLLLNMSRDGG